MSWQGTTAHSSQGYKYRDTIIIISSEIVYGHHQAGLACIAKTREEALKSLEDLMQKFDVKAKSSICRYKRFFELQHFSSWQSSEEYRNMALVRLKEISKGYSTGDFEAVFPYLDNACIFSSQWVLESLNGKERIIDYLRGEGETLRNHHACPKVVLAEEKGFGRFCLFMTQGKENDGALLFIELNKKYLITQISLCVSGFYDFQRYENDEKGD